MFSLAFFSVSVGVHWLSPCRSISSVLHVVMNLRTREDDTFYRMTCERSAGSQKTLSHGIEYQKDSVCLSPNMLVSRFACAHV